MGELIDEYRKLKKAYVIKNELIRNKAIAEEYKEILQGLRLEPLESAPCLYEENAKRFEEDGFIVKILKSYDYIFKALVSVPD